MSSLFAIDPGPVQSAWLLYATEQERVLGHGIAPNEAVLRLLVAGEYSAVVIEKVEGFGMPVGAEVFETVFWSGRFAQIAHEFAAVHRIGRKAIKVHLCGSMKAKDPNIRQALIDRFGGAAAKGTKAEPGPLYGISKDVWSALAVAVTAADTLP